MISFKPSYLGYTIATSLCATSIVKGWGTEGLYAVVALTVSLAYDFIERHYSTKNVEFKIPDDFKRKVQDIEARITTIEYGIKARGF